jgi:hypothetical protein
MYRLTKHRGGDDNFLRFAVFPVRDSNVSHCGFTSVLEL